MGLVWDEGFSIWLCFLVTMVTHITISMGRGGEYNLIRHQAFYGHLFLQHRPLEGRCVGFQTLYATLLGHFFPKPRGGEIMRNKLYISI